MKLRASFRHKLLLLTLIPLVVAQLVTLIAVMRTVERDVNTHTRSELAVGAGVVEQFLEARGQQLRTSVEVLAADFGLKQAVALRDAATIQSVLDNHGRRVGADLAAILDMDKGTLVATGEFGELSSQLSRADSVEGESTLLTSDHAYHLFVVPLRAPVTIGWVVLGFHIDAGLAERISALTGFDTTLVRQGEPPQLIARTSERPIGPSQTLRQVYNVSHAGHDVLSIQTRFVRGDPGVQVVLQRSVGAAMAPYLEARRSLILFSAGLLLIVALAGAWVSNSIARPLRTLGQAAYRLMAGNYQASVNYHSDDEFGELARSFNAMQAAIAEREGRISHQAMHHSLTDLPNRNYVLNLLPEVFAKADETDTPVSLLSLRLTRMSEISSTLGHSASDELIKTAAYKLRERLRESETLSHMGTNEFLIVVPGVDAEGAMSYVNWIDNLLGAGVTLDRVNVILRSRIGIAQYPSHSTTPDEILRFAAIARSEAERHNVPASIYETGREARFSRRLRVMNDLPSAIERGEIEVAFQPQLALPSGEIHGAEALVRWTHPELGPLRPDEFIPAAEQADTIVVLTRHVLATAVRECKRWEAFGHELNVSVNISTRDLVDELLPGYVAQLLKEARLPAERLTLEVTESAVMDNKTQAIKVLNRLRETGVRTALDDFGTGHSSLAQLRDLPLNELKIDKAFVMSLDESELDRAIVQSTIDLAHTMDLEVVAEGVENENIVRQLSQLNCEFAQGYFVSKPLSAQAFRRWQSAFEVTPYGDRRQSDRAFARPRSYA